MTSVHFAPHLRMAASLSWDQDPRMCWSAAWSQARPLEPLKHWSFCPLELLLAPESSRELLKAPMQLFQAPMEPLHAPIQPSLCTGAFCVHGLSAAGP